MNKTDSQELVGVHKFEVAGLGKAPFTFISMTTSIWRSGCGTVTKPGSSCDYCGTAICNVFNIRSQDGRMSKVGCDCIMKAGDEGILKAYKSTPEYRKAQKEKRALKNAAVVKELNALIEKLTPTFQAMPHPWGSTDYKTGKPLSYLDWIIRGMNFCGATGRAVMLKKLKKDFHQ